MATWAPKDPDAVLDYLYTIPLDQGDTVASYTLSLLAGTVAIDNQSRSGADVTAWLSGGEDGETAVFKIEWTTTLSRTNDDIITLAVQSADVPDLALTGYAKPAPGNLIARYPAFAAVPVSTIRAWLTDAERFVTDSWGEGDYAAGLMSLAAHNMALAGLGTDAASLSGVPAGVTALKSGSLALNFTPEAANARLTGDLTATRYGQEFAQLQARNVGGPRVAATGIAPPGAYPCFGGWW